MAKRTSELLSALGKAMDQPADALSPAAAGQLIQDVPRKPVVSGASKITATIYPADWRRLDDIKDFFRSRGYRNLSDSEALRIACRALRISDELIPFFEEMKREDGRQRNSA
jgi:hypothetical protein